VKIHELKIAFEYGAAKLRGEKLFEIRKNDRDFQVGDLVHYTLLPSGDEEKNGRVSLWERKAREVFANKRLYKIIYITDYAQQDGYVVFGEQEIKI